MSWSTIYIHGRTGFKKAVEEKLKNNWLDGYPENDLELMMYWRREESSLRDFKLAIGSKLIFKYRLRFYSSVDEYLALDKRKEIVFTSAENKMVSKMISWQKRNRKSKPFTTTRSKKAVKV